MITVYECTCELARVHAILRTLSYALGAECDSVRVPADLVAVLVDATERIDDVTKRLRVGEDLRRSAAAERKRRDGIKDLEEGSAE